jgi:hypothetical protein
MYQKPSLTRVGEAQEVILGIVSAGNDYDGSWITGQDEFAFDENDAE